jgi:hypothetical protein
MASLYSWTWQGVEKHPQTPSSFKEAPEGLPSPRGFKVSFG